MAQHTVINADGISLLGKHIHQMKRPGLSPGLRDSGQNLCQNDFAAPPSTRSIEPVI